MNPGDDGGGLGWLDIALPLWHRRGWLLLGVLAGAALAFTVAVMQPVRFTARASFVVQPVLKPSQAGAVAQALPGLAGLVGSGSTVDLYVAILRSRVVADRIIDRFELQRVWALPLRAQAQAKLARRVDFIGGRREGIVQVEVEDDHPQRAAAMADEFVEALRATLRGFALEEASQRRAFYEQQARRAREALGEAQRQLQASGYDRGALQAEPRAAAEAYGRLRAEIAAAEVRLAAARRVRTEDSSEVRQIATEIAALRAQLARMEVPQGDAAGGFVSRLREFRYAETLADSIARQAEAARVDEAADAVPLQLLDRAQVPQWPSHPRPLSWAAAGAGAALLLHGGFLVLRHRRALARQDPAWQQRLARLTAALPGRRRVDG